MVWHLTWVIWVFFFSRRVTRVFEWILEGLRSNIFWNNNAFKLSIFFSFWRGCAFFTFQWWLWFSTRMLIMRPSNYVLKSILVVLINCLLKSMWSTHDSFRISFFLCYWVFDSLLIKSFKTLHDLFTFKFLI